MLLPESYVTKFQEKAKEIRWAGVPVIDLSREELLAVVGDLCETLAASHENRKRTASFWNYLAAKNRGTEE